jgi:hypothetical protein
MIKMRNVYKILVENPEGKIILKWILERYIKGCGLDSSDSRWGPVAGSCKHSDELSEHKGR